MPLRHTQTDETSSPSQCTSRKVHRQTLSPQPLRQFRHPSVAGHLLGYFLPRLPRYGCDGMPGSVGAVREERAAVDHVVPPFTVEPQHSTQGRTPKDIVRLAVAVPLARLPSTSEEDESATGVSHFPLTVCLSVECGTMIEAQPLPVVIEEVEVGDEARSSQLAITPLTLIGHTAACRLAAAVPLALSQLALVDLPLAVRCILNARSVIFAGLPFSLVDLPLAVQ
mmetsp:Transcript_34687/g.85993  ORF Transcript_34687/g.85993 Transcript_34687/m.85993 type:complete len:225 (+) Transcript_34687:3793-4467(+)